MKKRLFYLTMTILLAPTVATLYVVEWILTGRRPE